MTPITAEILGIPRQLAAVLAVVLLSACPALADAIVVTRAMTAARDRAREMADDAR